jgi:hemerythrin
MTGANKLPFKTAPSTGSQTVDAEHGVQLGLLDAALSAFDPEGDSDAAELMNQLHAYTQVHFMSEQLLMRLAARANYDAHIEDHELLLTELDEVRALLARGNRTDARDRLIAHHSHLLDHIGSWDRSVSDQAV